MDRRGLSEKEEAEERHHDNPRVRNSAVMKGSFDFIYQNLFSANQLDDSTPPRIKSHGHIAEDSKLWVKATAAVIRIDHSDWINNHEKPDHGQEQFLSRDHLHIDLHKTTVLFSSFPTFESLSTNLTNTMDPTFLMQVWTRCYALNTAGGLCIVLCSFPHQLVVCMHHCSKRIFHIYHPT